VVADRGETGSRGGGGVETSDSVDYVFGDRVVGCRESDERAEVTFESGATNTFDLVIGADGLRSAMRSLVFGPEDDYVHHLGAYMAFFTVPNHLELDHWWLTYTEPGVMAAVRSIHDNRDAMAMFGFAAPALEYDYRDVEQQKQIVRERLAGAAWETPKLLRYMEDIDDFYFDSCSQVRMESWSKRRVVLVGDAAYSPSPPSGQGTSLAIVGAYLLAGELAATGGEHHAAFAAYERRMRDFVAVNQKLGVQGAKSFAPASNLGRWFQYQMIRLLPYLPGTSMMKKKIARTFNAIDLPDYPRVPTAVR
jgi:2-polyprenyl-6-methoxyphenol hydroxylase-like FAD-dependent oxidoreductase